MSLDSNDYDYFDERFRGLTHATAKVERLYQGCRWAEGPVWFADGNFLIWSDVSDNRMLRWLPELGTSVFRAPSNNSNGNFRDQQGRLLTCEHLTRRVTRTEADGSITVLADRYNGKRFNSPNDLVVKSDGGIWFTDPSYGIMSDYEGDRAEMEQSGCHVYRLDPKTGTPVLVADDFVQPNGLAFSPDEKILYIADSGSPHHIRAFDVGADGKLSKSRVFAVIDKGVPDGFRVDTTGNVWTSAEDGVIAYGPDGVKLGRINIPEIVANLTFGGAKRNRLFITATTSIYAVYVNANGVQRP